MIFFYFLIGVMPLTSHPFWSRTVSDLTVFKYLGAVSLLYAVSYLVVCRKFPPFFGTWQARLFLILYLIAAVSYFTKALPSPWEFSPFLSFTSFLLLFFITLSVVDTERRLHRVLLVAIGSVAFASIYVIREWQVYHTVYRGLRPGSVVGDSNYFTISALVCLPLAFYFMLERPPRWERCFCLGCLVLTSVGVTLGASRGGALGLVAGFLFAVWRSRRRVRNLALGSVLLVPLSLMAPSSPVRRFLQPSFGDKESVVARTTAWKVGLRMIQAHPLMGVGLGNFKPLMPRYADPGTKVSTIAHNTYVELAAETGLPSLLVFLAILFFSLRTLERVRRAALRSGQALLWQAVLGIQAGLVGYAVASFFVSAEYQKLFWLMVFLSMCLQSLTTRPARALTNERKA